MALGVSLFHRAAWVLSAAFPFPWGPRNPHLVGKSYIIGTDLLRRDHFPSQLTATSLESRLSDSTTVFVNKTFTLRCHNKWIILEIHITFQKRG